MSAVNIYFVFVAHGNVSRLGKLATTEERLCLDIGDYVDGARWFAHVVVEICDVSGRSGMAVSEGKCFG